MYKAVYKCRLCGETFRDDKWSEKEAKEMFLENCHDIWMEHRCKNGSVGVADFQGFKKVGD